jgi:redox-sensing transcriptional repressor
MKKLSEKMIGRLSLYRRVLSEMETEGQSCVFSHDLAAASGVTAAQVRRDVMTVGCNGSPTSGYEVARLIAGIGALLDGGIPQSVALIGIGNLGRALLSYFMGRRPNLKIIAAFDRDESLVNRVLHGVRTYPMHQLPGVIREQDIRTAVIAVPASQGQTVADEAIRAGVTGLLNFAPCHLRVPPHIYVEQVDITTSLEKVAFFARQDVPV